jgi:hypothetical protein
MVLIMSGAAIMRTPMDIFPNIDIPVVAVDWTYTGLNPEEPEGRLTSTYERVLTSRAHSHLAGRASQRVHRKGPVQRSRWTSLIPYLVPLDGIVGAVGILLGARTLIITHVLV